MSSSPAAGSPPAGSSPAGAPLTVALLAGGRSSEHEVSLASGAAVHQGLLAAGHRVLPVRIERDGAWRANGERLSVTPGAGLLDADVVFPVLHGPYGEDGAVQGVLETLDVAYVGADVAASALCMDKVLFKGLMATAGVPQVPYVGVREDRWRAVPREVEAELDALGLPVFVKPAHLGSSVGIAKVAAHDRLRPALHDAFAHDALVIVEAIAPGLEIECAVLGCAHEERTALAPTRAAQAPTSVPAPPSAFASEPGEIVLPGEWYDYEAKYSAGGMELVVPARISPVARERVRQLAVQAFAYVGCEGLARADFFVHGEQVLLNELNTMPGFTSTSVYAKLIHASGIAYEELLDRLCRLALGRHQTRRRYSY